MSFNNICSYSMTPNTHMRFTHQINTSASEASHVCDNPAKLRLRACHVSSVQLQHSGWEDGDLTPVTIFTCCRQTAWHCRVVRAVYPDTPPPSSLFGVCFSLSACLPDFVDNLELKKKLLTQSSEFAWILLSNYPSLKKPNTHLRFAFFIFFKENVLSCVLQIV